MTTSLKADDPQFIPQPIDEDGGLCEVRANVKERVSLPYRAIVTVDCGFELGLPLGYRPRLSPMEGLACRGFMVLATKRTPGLAYDRIHAIVTNVGKEVLTIDPGQYFALISAEPEYGLIFNTTE